MRMPDILGEQLTYCEKAADENELWELLLGSPPHLVAFFEYSSADETWSSTYPFFTRRAIEWFTEQYFQDKFDDLFAQRVAACLQKHFTNLEPLIPFNLTVELGHYRKDKINSLLFQTASPFLKRLIRSYCQENNRTTLSLKDIEQSNFAFLKESIHTGEAKELWKMPPDDVRNVLKLAGRFELTQLSEACQTILKRYIDRETVFETLSYADKGTLEVLKTGCLDFINQLHIGLHLASKGPHTLVCRVDGITEEDSDYLKNICPFITHLVCGPKLMDDFSFAELLASCPALLSVDLGETLHFTPEMLMMPHQLSELNFLGCAWLDDGYLKQFINAYPALRHLNLTSCSKVGPQGWGELVKLHQLISLSLNRCGQISDQDLMGILHACSGIADLDLSECSRLTDQGFFSLAKSGLRLVSLNLGSTKISDQPLIELLTHMHTLNALVLSRCQNLTEVGIIEGAANARALKEINITRCDMPAGATEHLRVARPFLRIIDAG